MLLWARVYCVYALVPSWSFYCKLSETCLKYNLIPQHIEFYRYGIEIITNFESDWLAKILIFFTSPSVTGRWDYTCGEHTVFKPKISKVSILTSTAHFVMCGKESHDRPFLGVWGFVQFEAERLTGLVLYPKEQCDCSESKIAQDTGSKFSPKTVPQCNSMNEPHGNVNCPAWGCALHLIAVVSDCTVELF